MMWLQRIAVRFVHYSYYCYYYCFYLLLWVNRSASLRFHLWWCCCCFCSTWDETLWVWTAYSPPPVEWSVFWTNATHVGQVASSYKNEPFPFLQMKAPCCEQYWAYTKKKKRRRKKERFALSERSWTQCLGHCNECLLVFGSSCCFVHFTTTIMLWITLFFLFA